jgi:hypothetical protein
MVPMRYVPGPIGLLCPTGGMTKKHMTNVPAGAPAAPQA